MIKKDEDATEFFVKAIYEWFCGTQIMSNHFLDLAITSFNVNNLYRKEILNQMN